MGCQTSSSRVKVIDSFTDSSSVQQEGESFRCQVKAVRYALKDSALRCVFREYLATQDVGTDFLTCYCEIEDLKAQPDAVLIPMLNATLARYQLQYEQQQRAEPADRPSTNCGMNALWGKLKQLTTLNVSNITRAALLRALTTTQNHMLSELVEPFDEFLESPVFRQQLRAHRASNAQAYPFRQTAAPVSPTNKKANRQPKSPPPIPPPMHGGLSPSVIKTKNNGTPRVSPNWALSSTGRTSTLSEIDCGDLTVLM